MTFQQEITENLQRSSKESMEHSMYEYLEELHTNMQSCDYQDGVDDDIFLTALHMIRHIYAKAPNYEPPMLDGLGNTFSLQWRDGHITIDKINIRVGIDMILGGPVTNRMFHFNKTYTRDDMEQIATYIVEHPRQRVQRPQVVTVEIEVSDDDEK